MTKRVQLSAAGEAERLASEFLRQVWSSPPRLAAIDELMTEDYVITSGGQAIAGREDFKAWVQAFQDLLIGATTTSYEVFSNPRGDRVVSRWRCEGRSNGIFELPADGRPVWFTDIAIWRVRDGKLAECWVERSALEASRRAPHAPENT